MKEDYSEEGSNNYWVHFCTHLDSKNECSCATAINSHGGIEEECAVITGYFHKCKSTKLEGSLVDRISGSPIEDRPQEGWEWVEVGGTRAIKAYSIRYLDINYFIPTEDGYIYQIDLETSCPKETKEECENKYELILDQILSTFKFVEKSQDETADWKIYRNEEYGFEFGHPANWIYFEKEEKNEEVRNNLGWVYYIKLKPKDKEYFYEGAEEYPVNIRILNKNKWDKIDGDIDLIIDNIPATKFITKMGEYTAWELTATQEPNSKDYYFEFFNPIYVLSNDTELDNLLEIFDKIFSSFKFLK